MKNQEKVPKKILLWLCQMGEQRNSSHSRPPNGAETVIGACWFNWCKCKTARFKGSEIKVNIIFGKICHYFFCSYWELIQSFLNLILPSLIQFVARKIVLGKITFFSFHEEKILKISHDFDRQQNCCMA